MTFFDVIEEQQRAIRGGQERGQDTWVPFAMVAHSDDTDAKLQWLNSVCELLKEQNRDRYWQMLENIYFYNGIQHRHQTGSDLNTNTRHRQQAGGRYLKRGDVFVMNHARDFVNQKVAMLTRFKPNINALSWGSTYKDRLAAKFSKRIVDTIFYDRDLPSITRKGAFHSTVCGEGYVKVSFNQHLGGLTADQATLNMQAAELGEEGTLQTVNVDGEEVVLDIQKRMGDIDLKVIAPWLLLKEPALTWSDVDYVFEINLKHINQLQLENPDVDFSSMGIAQHKVDGGSGFGEFSPFLGTHDYAIEIEFYHRSTPLLDSGYYCKFVGNIMLDEGPIPTQSGELPFARLTDYDDVLTPHGRSFLEDLRSPLILHNKLVNHAYRNIAIAGHPKLMIPEGSTTVEAMGSSPLVVKYNPAVGEPRYMTFQTVTGEVFNLSADLMRQTQQVAGVFGLSRGDTVPNARAAEILSIYQEEEEQRNGITTDKYIAWIEKIGKLVLDCASVNYKPGDGREVKVFGKHSQQKLRKLTESYGLLGPSGIKVERTTSLDNTRQGKINKIVQLSQVPTQDSKPLFSRESMITMLDMAHSSAFVDDISHAVDTADDENEDMYEDIPVADPAACQNHLVHWRRHYTFMQSREFSDTTSIPKSVIAKFAHHMYETEKLMYEQCKQSLSYALEVEQLRGFPCEYKIGPMTALPEDQLTVAQIIQQHQMPPMGATSEEQPQ